MEAEVIYEKMMAEADKVRAETEMLRRSHDLTDNQQKQVATGDPKVLANRDELDEELKKAISVIRKKGGRVTVLLEEGPELAKLS